MLPLCRVTLSLTRSTRLEYPLIVYSCFKKAKKAKNVNIEVISKTPNNINACNGVKTATHTFPPINTTRFSITIAENNGTPIKEMIVTLIKNNKRKNGSSAPFNLFNSLWYSLTNNGVGVFINSVNSKGIVMKKTTKIDKANIMPILLSPNIQEA